MHLEQKIKSLAEKGCIKISTCSKSTEQYPTSFIFIQYHFFIDNPVLSKDRFWLLHFVGEFGFFSGFRGEQVRAREDGGVCIFFIGIVFVLLLVL